MSLVYCLAGTNHFIHPRLYKNIMPAWLPYHYPLIYISGVVEIALGVLLLSPATRRFAAWGIILLLIAVFPANIQMMLNYYERNDPGLWIAVLRLPVQALLIYWAYIFARKQVVV